jgi:putative tryptophan/tyrosine transport system substrate-binding protein
MIGRREFVSLLGGTTVAWPLAARAQQSAMPVIGALYGVAAPAWAGNMAEFRRGLGETGFVEGRNVAIEYRWADGQFDQLPGMAADLVSRKVAVILAGGSVVSVQAAMAATKTIPIVFTVTNDPVAAGFVASLNRPGGNVTGVTLIGIEVGQKRLELLHEIVPSAARIALLVNQNNPVSQRDSIQSAQTASRRLKLEIIVVNAGTANEIEGAVANAVQQRAAALLVGADAFLSSRQEQIAALALRHALPASGTQREAVTAGMLMSYGSSNADMYRQVGIYAGRILKGEKPADLPVMQPTKFALVINLKTAKALGLDVPASLLARADEVVE